MKPLHDITVLEFSTMVTASLATMMMAEQGARVIKVEPIETGDPLRYLGTAKGGISAIFANCNRGKQSIRVDLKTEEGRNVIVELAKHIDVLIHNFRPGVMDELKLGSDALRSNNDRLIYTAISGFGKGGPLASAPAYDPVIQAHAGFTASQGTDTPTFIRNLMCDKITAYTACQAVTSALFHRERTGQGQHLDVAMLDAGLFFIFPDAFMNHTLLDGDVVEQPLLADLLYELTETKDGAITISAGTDRQRLGVVQAVGREDLFQDPRFSSLESLMENLETFRGILREAFLELTTADALKRLQQQDVPCARCHGHDEVLTQPQLDHNGTVVERDHPLMGRMRVIRSPARFHGEPLPVTGHAPAHGEHTEDVLLDFGFSKDDLAAWRNAGSIA
ncbi:MAG: CoA transferase [Pseudomonadales bacterium]|nr:CoA transferase [Pseudomonadales bacterium]